MTIPSRPWPAHSCDDTPTGPLYDYTAAAWSPVLPLASALPRRRPRPPPTVWSVPTDEPDLDSLRRVRDGLRDLPTEPR